MSTLRRDIGGRIFVNHIAVFGRLKNALEKHIDCIVHTGGFTCNRHKGQTNIIRCHIGHIHIAQWFDYVVPHLGFVALQCSRRDICGLHEQPFFTVIRNSGIRLPEDDFRNLFSRFALLLKQLLTG